MHYLILISAGQMTYHLHHKYDDQIIHQKRNVIFDITEKTSFQRIDINIRGIF